ncbi:hypothetical protein CDL15_Pgr022177 [Punica granatum]|nr:hypothetical protein CDL15_Pgr022177 [Punica granatum]
MDGFGSGEETRVVVVFDFDKTILDCDSDNWVVDQFGLSDTFRQLLLTGTPWNTLMDQMMSEIHSLGKSIGDIADCLRKALLHPRIASAIRSAHSAGCDLRILSDANMFFIKTILEHNGLMDCFSMIYTNPSFINESGRLRILPYHDFNKSIHGCNTCPPNMCKGLIMEKLMASSSTKGEELGNRFIYVGDGSADFCAGLALRAKDTLMPRKDFPVWELVCKNQKLIKAEVHEWSDGEGLEAVLLSSIKRALISYCQHENGNFDEPSAY